MAIEKYKKSDAIAEISEQIVQIKSTYDLVRLENISIANQDNKNIVADMIMDLNEFSSITRKMNAGQIAETVNMLLNEYPNLSLQEYQYFFNKIKSGYFGQLYESLDGIKIMAFMQDFYKEINASYNDMNNESEYQRKIDQGSRDIDQWQKY